MSYRTLYLLLFTTGLFLAVPGAADAQIYAEEERDLVDEAGEDWGLGPDDALDPEFREDPFEDDFDDPYDVDLDYEDELTDPGFDDDLDMELYEEWWDESPAYEGSFYDYYDDGFYNRDFDAYGREGIRPPYYGGRFYGTFRFGMYPYGGGFPYGAYPYGTYPYGTYPYTPEPYLGDYQEYYYGWDDMSQDFDAYYDQYGFYGDEYYDYYDVAPYEEDYNFYADEWWEDDGYGLDDDFDAFDEGAVNEFDASDYWE